MKATDALRLTLFLLLTGYTGIYSRAQMPFVPANDPLITAMVAEVNTDSIHKTLRELQDWGSRFMLRDNHKTVATWLMNKFISLGYPDVKIDSFYVILDGTFGYTDSTWQYNVVCNLQGSTAPDDIYVIGGHYDSFCSPDPYSLAPGVDDNGSSVAAILEMARVMAKLNYHPKATIQLTLFGAEELGLFGSGYDSHTAKLQGRDIRLMFNMDMIAYDPDNLNQMRVTEYLNAPWEARAAANAIQQYTDITANLTTTGGGDSYNYWLQGFPTVSYEESIYSPYMHTPADTLGNCNLPFLSKVTGGILAALADQILYPPFRNLGVHSGKTSIILGWKPVNLPYIQGVNVYRSDTKGGQYQKINQNLVTDSLYQDFTPEPNKRYYYVLTTFNDSLQESGFSEELSGARFNFSDTLLVLANLKGTEVTPDSVYQFYRDILDTIPFVWYDLNATKKVDIGMLSRYRFIFDMSNSVHFEVQDDTVLNDFRDFTANGGNLMYAGFNPMQFWTNNSTYPVKIPDTTLFYEVFKVDTVNRIIQSMMNRANAVAPGYDTLNVDPLKSTSNNFPGQINNVEVFIAASGAGVIYRFDSEYDSATILGRMKNHPVGIEYMGSDFKSILLSFPLYYMDTNDARRFLHYVMKEKFIHPVGIEAKSQFEPLALHIYPNPVTLDCSLDFILVRPGFVKLTLLTIQGQLLSTWFEGDLGQGFHTFHIQPGVEAPGIYQVVMQSNEGNSVRKIIKLR